MCSYNLLVNAVVYEVDHWGATSAHLSKCPRNLVESALGEERLGEIMLDGGLEVISRG